MRVLIKNMLLAALFFSLLTTLTLAVSVAQPAPDQGTNDQQSRTTIMMSDKSLSLMSTMEQSILIKDVISGRPVVVLGSGALLRRMLGMPSQPFDTGFSYYTENETAASTSEKQTNIDDATTINKDIVKHMLSVKFHGLMVEPAKGVVHEYYGSTTEGSSNEGLQRAMMWVSGLLTMDRGNAQRRALQALRVGDTTNWDTIRTETYDDYIPGQVSFHYALDEYRLHGDNDPESNWYRIDITEQHAILSYSYDGTWCGYYMVDRMIGLDGNMWDTEYGNYQHTTLITYGPSGDSAGSTTSYALSIDAGGIHASWSTSYLSYAVTTYDQSIYRPEERAQWKQVFLGPTYGGILPFTFNPPCAAAQASYQSYHSAVFQARGLNGVCYGTKINVARFAEWYKDYVWWLPPFFNVAAINHYVYQYQPVDRYIYLDWWVPYSGPGCPFLSVWDGAQFVNEGLLNIHAAQDVVTAHELRVSPEPVGERYLLRLSEHLKTHSNVDKVQLLAVSKDGKVIELPLVSAIHSTHGSVLNQLLRSDDVRIDMLGANFNEGVSESIDLQFVAPPGLEISQFRFVIEGYNPIVK